MLTPQQAVEQEEARLRGEATAPPQEANEPEKPEEVDLEALEAKVQKGEKLTEAETIRVTQLDAELKALEDAERQAAEVSNKTYQVDGKVIPFKEIEAQFRKAHGVEGLELNEAALVKLVDTYAQTLNKNVATRKIDQGFKENAEERRRLADERARMAAEKRAFLRQKQELELDRTELLAVVKAAIGKEEVKESGNDPDVMEQYLKGARAKEELAKVEKKIALADAGIREADGGEVRAEVALFIETNPQYQTSVPFDVLAQRYDQGAAMEPEDKRKVREIFRMMRQAKSEGGSLQDVFEDEKARGTLAVKPVAQAGNGHSQIAAPTIPSESQTLAQKIAKVRAKKALAPGSIGGGGEQGREQGRERASTTLVKHDRQYAGVPSEDREVLKTLGY